MSAMINNRDISAIFARAVPPFALDIPEAIIWPSSTNFSIIVPDKGAIISVSSSRSLTSSSAISASCTSVLTSSISFSFIDIS